MKKTTPPKVDMTHRPSALMFGLANSFPCIRSKLHLIFQNHYFEPTLIAIRMNNWSEGERQVGLFLLNVWNWGHAESMGWNFNSVEAVKSWDADSRAAYAAWCKTPFFP